MLSCLFYLSFRDKNVYDDRLRDWKLVPDFFRTAIELILAFLILNTSSDLFFLFRVLPLIFLSLL